jgi:TrmH family RNA methyltransferase
MAKYKRYSKDAGYSYSLGIFLTIELLYHQPSQVIEVIVSSDTDTSKGVQKIEALCHSHNIPITTNDKVINSLSPKGNCFAIGIFKTYQQQVVATENHLVLVNPSDSGNLGTMMRAALGFNIKNLVIIRPAVDLFDPKTIRASMGSFFNLNFSHYETFEDYEQQHPTHSLYPFMLQAKAKLKEIVPIYPFSLIFGNEATGLDPSFIDKGTSIVIPHSHQIDSLNLAVAASVAMYEFTKETF